MRTLVNGIAFIVCLFGLVSHAAADAERPDLLIYTENYEPFYFRDENGGIAGRVTNIVRTLAQDAGVSITMRLAPFKRGLLVTQRKPNTCFMALWRTEAREPNFEWVGPLQIDGFAYFALAENKIKLSAHSDTFAYSTGAVAGWTSTMDAQQAGHPRLTLVDSDILNVDMLLAGRIDLWLGGLLSAPYIADKRGIKIKNVFTLKEVDLSLACHPDSNPDVLSRLRKSLKLRYSMVDDPNNASR
ncbi:ABC transporter substrate-binding protein [Labrenzia sp. PHM005]|uniref:substrate-binding periplasmic protein n=1 Tax=Labrenzia sp. PHM005 TaxID=2590016 RepID=UPI0011404335|nr:transporter substrate-binding domain-containing protein [Labrenzia sp. PHM005]QDG76515.1 transporter substrate-binding domain-containing protein [Labrenzia sp. PHM005]